MGYGGRVARTALTPRTAAAALDAADPLAGFRDRFALARRWPLKYAAMFFFMVLKRRAAAGASP